MSTATEYVRNRQIPTGRMEARDLRPGDKILMRVHGALERTEQKIVATAFVFGEVCLSFESGEHKKLSPRMPVALA